VAAVPRRALLLRQSSLPHRLLRRPVDPLVGRRGQLTKLIHTKQSPHTRDLDQ